MLIPYTIFTIIVCFSIVSCGSSHDEKITGVYSLSAIDTDQQMSIYYTFEDGGGVGRINETVFACGFNDRYIVAKQHPKGDKSIINYYYLDISKDSRYAEPSDSVTGPLNKESYDIASHKLNLPPFTRILNHLK